MLETHLATNSEAGDRPQKISEAGDRPRKIFRLETDLDKSTLISVANGVTGDAGI
jgi:hypothetical protein